MGKTGTILAAGLVSIGLVTAAFGPGRQTVSGIKAVTDGGSKLFGTVISGK